MQTLKHIGIIALNTFRESIRDKILYNIGFFGYRHDFVQHCAWRMVGV